MAEYRSYDPMIGRWLQIDPKTSERESPYVGFGNRPNFFIDPLGDTVRVLTTNDPRTNDGATYIADNVTVTAEPEVPATRSDVGDLADAFGIDIRPRQVIISGDGPMGDDSHLPAPDPNAKTVNFDMETSDALGALGSSKLKRGKAAKNASGQTGRNNVNDVTKDAFGSNVHNGTKRGIGEFAGASKPQGLSADIPDTVSAKTVVFDGGKIYREDSLKFKDGRVKIIRRQIDSDGKIIK